ncbi:MAG: hypothetical protein AAGA91_10120 [Pseudomonadota bacterium]
MLTQADSALYTNHTLHILWAMVLGVTPDSRYAAIRLLTGLAATFFPAYDLP